MICLLCKKNKRLIDAHIIPKWAYVYLYSEEKVKGPALLLINTRRHKKSRIGIYDPNILCQDCDSFLGEYDDYGKKVLIKSSIELFQNSNIAYVIKNVNIKKLHLFFLSVLWRSSISKKEELKNTDLGIYEDKVFSILDKAKKKQNIDKELEDFDIVVARFGFGKFPDLVDRNMQIPLSHRIDGINFQVIYFPKGFKVFIKTDKRELPQSLKKVQLKSSDLIIPKLNDFEYSHEFKFMLKALTKT